jgi:hypothetical protein
MHGFSALTKEQLGWYVYLLRDPRDGCIFYVGKGHGSRAFEHEANAVANTDHPELQSAKAARIREIINAGRRVEVEILRHGIPSATQAYEVESAAIDLANALSPGTLLNAVLGHHHAQRGLMSANEIEIMYAAEPAPPLTVPVILVSLNQLRRADATEDQLREMTSGWWNTRGRRRDRAHYVLGVHNGVVRTAYRPKDWRPRGPQDRDWEHDADKPSRWGFTPEPAPEMSRYLRTSVARFLTNNQWSHRYIEPEIAEE